MTWFTGVTDIQTLRQRYRELLRKHHPDNGGNVSDMQSINAEYDILFADLSKVYKSDSQSYTHEENEHFKVILNEITAFNMTVEIIGSWVWCFNAYPYKDRLKALGFTWCSKKKAWMWHDEPYHRHHKQEIPFNDIKAKYGCHTVKTQSYQYSLN